MVESAIKPELKPCPFCGGRAQIQGGILTQYVMCHSCEVMGPNLADTNELVEAWNTRPHEAEQKPSTDVAISELQKEISALQQLLHYKVCGDPIKGVFFPAKPDEEEG